MLSRVAFVALPARLNRFRNEKWASTRITTTQQELLHDASNTVRDDVAALENDAANASPDQTKMKNHMHDWTPSAPPSAHNVILAKLTGLTRQDHDQTTWGGLLDSH